MAGRVRTHLRSSVVGYVAVFIALTGSALLLAGAGTASAKHGTDDRHLLPTTKNMELVSKLKPSSHGPAVTPRQIGDLTVHKGFAYLQSGSNCEAGKGGFYVVDIRNPAAPTDVNFTPALPSTYHGEGAQAIRIDTPAFSGDVLAVNNEECSVAGSGGFDLYNVSNPAAPVPLVQGFGDVGGDGTLTGGVTDANQAHSIFIWDAGNNAYAAVVDNEELHDLDIFDITNPASPQAVDEYDLFDTAFSDDAHNPLTSLSDIVVKQIGGQFKLLAAYRDAGYVQLDAQDPAALQYDADSDFGGNDPLTGFNPPEGNANYAEYSHDNRFLLTAEEDLSTSRTLFDITTGPNAGRYDSGEFSFSQPIATLPDKRLNGPTVYGGYGCDAVDEIPAADTAIPPGELAAGEEQIVVVQRGPVNDPSHPFEACRFDEKMQNAIDKGYEGILIANHHAGAQNGASPDTAFCGSGDTRAIRGMCIGHRAFHLLFDDDPDYDSDYTPNSEPAGGTRGQDVAAETVFDGWGYMSLYGTTPDEQGKFPLLDAHAIREALDPRYASGFGELSIREQAADPTAPLTYASYRSGGMRVFSFEADTITEQGAFIDEGGNDMWGVEQFTSGNGERLIAGSDRDYGLYILRYTGPLAPQPAAPPQSSDAAGTPPPEGGSTPPPEGGSAPPPSGGAREFPRTLSISYSKKKDAFGGALASQAASCIASEKVSVFEKKKGKDPKLGSPTTSASGKYSLKEKNAEGSFYAKVGQTGTSGGTCLAAQSKTIKVG